MTSGDWRSGHPVLGLFLNGDEIPYRNRRGEPIRDDSFLLLVNAHHEDVPVPAARAPLRRRVGGRGRTPPRTSSTARASRPTREVPVQSRSMVLLRRVAD